MQITSIAVDQTTAITDLLLALVVFYFTFRLRGAQTPRRWKQSIWTWTFAILGTSAALGTIAHGLVLSQGASNIVWHAIYFTLGVGVALFVVGVMCDLHSEVASRRSLPWLVIVGLGFYLLTVTMPQGFILFIYYQAVALGGSLLAYVYLMARKAPGAGWMALGLAISIVGAAIEGTYAFTFSLMIWEFDHNSVYHVLQGLGFACLTLGLRRSLQQPVTASSNVRQ